ncbi:MAG: hypothetical protein H7Y61_00100 [Rhizobiales bacterium]|nr:hypothetical protein [Rhizobacter sp.]
MPRTLQALGLIERAAPALHSVFVANHKAAADALEVAHARPGGSSEVLRHDNSGMEFGAYQAGLDRLLGACDPDWVLFANDTFATHHSFGAVHRTKLAADLNRSFEHPAIIGQVVSWPRSFQLDGLRTHRWMTTNLFALNRAALRALDRRVYWPGIESLVTETSEMKNFFAPNVDRVLREHLEAWLFRARPGWHWYASDPLQPANAAKMARKARSILQEKYLAALLESLGAEFVNLNELSVSRKVLREAERKFFALTNRNP